MQKSGEFDSKIGGEVGYIAPYALLKSIITMSRQGFGGARVEMPLEAFGKIFELALRQVGFDETGYLKRNPDVAAAVSKGEIKSGVAHFARNGFFENRPMTPPAVDAAFYLKQYPDVDRSIALGQIKSAADHWAQNGFEEGRVPSSALVAEVESWRALVSR
jgi:hypothetical protein